VFSAAGVLTLTVSLAAVQAVPAPPPAAAAPPEQPLTRLFQNLAEDFRRLPSLESATIATAGGGGALIAHRVDDDLRSWGDRHVESGYTGLGRVGGDGWLHAGAAIGTYAFGLVKHHQTATHLGSDLIRAQVLNGVITRVIKLAAHRERPSGSSDSMPSGHASASFATAAVLGGHFGWRVAVPAYAGAGFIGWTRVRDRAHWLSDVVVGAAIGTIAGRTVTRGHRARGWTVVPTAGRRTVGVMVIRASSN
jgi:membrane-associated phospholipid phosphatase